MLKKVFVKKYKFFFGESCGAFPCCTIPPLIKPLKKASIQSLTCHLQFRGNKEPASDFCLEELRQRHTAKALSDSIKGFVASVNPKV
jgi:hypothetical protein